MFFTYILFLQKKEPNTKTQGNRQETQRVSFNRVKKTKKKIMKVLQ